MTYKKIKVKAASGTAAAEPVIIIIFSAVSASEQASKQYKR